MFDWKIGFDFLIFIFRIFDLKKKLFGFFSKFMCNFRGKRVFVIKLEFRRIEFREE